MNEPLPEVVTLTKHCLLGLDLSLTETGFYCSKAGGVLKPKIKGVERLKWYADAIGDLVTAHKITRACIENYAFAKQTGRMASIGEQGGVVRVRLFEMGVEMLVVPPTVLKKFVCGTGAAKKNEMMLHIFKKWGVVFSNDNAADAYALWRLGLAVYRWQKTEQTPDGLAKLPLKKDVEIFKKVEILTRN